MTMLFLHCRTGFEAECAAEIQEHAAQLEVFGFCKTKPNSGYVVFERTAGNPNTVLIEKIDFSRLIFARQWFKIISLRNDLPVNDRVSVIVDVLKTVPQSAAQLFIETPDTNDAKQLSSLCRAIKSPLAMALERKGLYGDDNSPYRLVVCFLSTSAAYIGYTNRNNSAPWPMGIPRLKMPRNAPSRSTLKLEEALLTFFSAHELDKIVKTDMTAVDLGASPGGWTYQLISRGLHVTAVDNGMLSDAIFASGLVQHRREDGFKYKPENAVDWMVCDIVEQPKKVAELCSRWLENGDCRRTIFNLKLPMKKRYQEVKSCLEMIEQRLNDRRLKHKIVCRQLYHDRDEVTVYVGLE